MQLADKWLLGALVTGGGVSEGLSTQSQKKSLILLGSSQPVLQKIPPSFLVMPQPPSKRTPNKAARAPKFLPVRGKPEDSPADLIKIPEYLIACPHRDASGTASQVVLRNVNILGCRCAADGVGAENPLRASDQASSPPSTLKNAVGGGGIHMPLRPQPARIAT